MKRKLTPEMLKKYLGNSLMHPYYTDVVKEYNRLAIHYKGKNYGDLINERRPGESLEKKNYREKIMVEITENPLNSVITELGKIRRADDWAITYQADKFPTIVAKEETLMQYMEVKYPSWGSFENWLFNVCLPIYCIDANAVILNMPQEWDLPSNEYRKPVNYIFDSSLVIDFVEDEYCVLKSKEKVLYGKGTVYGDVFYVADKEKIVRYEQANGRREFNEYTYAHKLGKLPARKMRGLVLDTVGDETIYKSRLRPMAPSLDEAAREYSDLQAELVQHVFSEKYQFATTDCTECRGSGRVKEGKTNVVEVACKSCNGSGRRVVSPYNGTYNISIGELGDKASIPTPPIAYIEKNPEIAKFLDEHVRQHRYDALSAVNMQFLAQVPLNSSGESKSYDQDALNTLVTNICEDLVNIADWSYGITNEWRYYDIIATEEQRKLMLPTIHVPTQFNKMMIKDMLDEMSAAKTAGLNSSIMAALQSVFTHRKFNSNMKRRDFIDAIILLDPLSGKSDGEKISLKNANAITEETFIVSCNIVYLLTVIIEKQSDPQVFYSKSYEEKMKLLNAEAALIIANNKAAEQERLKAEASMFNPMQ